MTVLLKEMAAPTNRSLLRWWEQPNTAAQAAYSSIGNQVAAGADPSLQAALVKLAWLAQAPPLAVDSRVITERQDACFVQGLALQRAGRSVEAAAVLQSCELTADALLMFVRSLPYPEERAALQSLAELAVRLPITNIALGLETARDYTARGLSAEADALLRHIAASAPDDDPTALFALGEAAWQQGDITAGIEFFRRAATAAPGDEDTQSRLVNALARTGQGAEALAAAQAWLQHSPDSKAALLAVGDAYFRAEEYDQAATWFDRASKLDATDPFPVYRLGLIAQRQGNNAEAVRLLQEARALNPEYSDVYVALATIAAEQGDLASAARYMQQGAELAAGCAASRYVQAGEYLYMLGDTATAEALFAHATACAPDDKALADQIAKIKQAP